MFGNVTYGGGARFGGSATFRSQGGRASAPQFGGSHLLMPHPLMQNDHIWQGEEGMFLGCATPYVPGGRSPITPQLLGSLYVYTLQCRMTKFGTVTHAGEDTSLCVCVCSWQSWPSCSSMVTSWYHCQPSLATWRVCRH